MSHAVVLASLTLPCLLFALLILIWRLKLPPFFFCLREPPAGGPSRSEEPKIREDRYDAISYLSDVVALFRGLIALAKCNICLKDLIM